MTMEKVSQKRLLNSLRKNILETSDVLRGYYGNKKEKKQSKNKDFEN